MYIYMSYHNISFQMTIPNVRIYASGWGSLEVK